PDDFNSFEARFRAEVVERGDFTQDWFTAHVESLEAVLQPFAGRAARMLEIGSFEGLSTCYFLRRLPELELTCVDTFEGSVGLPSGGREGLEDAFDRNVALVDASRVRKLRGDSKRMLLDLVDEHARFDLVYVDGSHRGLDVLVDAALSWPLLELGGVVVFDDYRWTLLGDDPLLRPGPAIDAFVGLVSVHGEVVFQDRQVALRRLD
ncbi:MAG: class I SAM-dependent methyltransferase, partial [Actinobacteria bacterium]|nr:class I SAM-dependent methyltransferase [Actinomycetota bacterium]